MRTQDLDRHALNVERQGGNSELWLRASSGTPRSPLKLASGVNFKASIHSRLRLPGPSQALIASKLSALASFQAEA